MVVGWVGFCNVRSSRCMLAHGPLFGSSGVLFVVGNLIVEFVVSIYRRELSICWMTLFQTGTLGDVGFRNVR